ncbi:retrovirus-related Pol polyprotein from type-1 retrotransposable element R2 [Caerostris extrusa]|uniref:Retrovirus-related Pol polyprotein from type-1 retrotransposable element R2 n=1 Tax=Caerostris extrusa TaxID=172846 RepID=A0AAV4Y2T4_CAEEX|nr:retrovirus-related Pol polyprotein from type-1 retrotransposable element R2 [Caerostris extrusa]
MGIPIAAEESDLNAIDSAFKLLTSRDERLREMVVEHLSRTVRPRVKRPPTDQDLSDYLSGDIEGSFSTTSNKLANIWTIARCASRRLNVEWVFEDNVPRLIFQDLILKPQQRRRVLFSIRDRLRVDRSLKLMNKLNQGKVLKLISLSPASSHFVSNGAYTRFADWRFIHKARLNLVPLNGCQQWKVGNDKLCRRCNNWPETLPHDVLSFCQKGFMPYDGVLEHNFIIQQSIERARSSKKDICIAWLDVTNAFEHFLTRHFLTLFEPSMWENPWCGSLKMCTQGCPLSGLLFNIALDPVIRSLQGASEHHRVLAFADDLCLLANCPTDLQELLDKQMQRLGLHLNPNKSFAFHLQGYTPVGTRDTSFYLNNHRLISIQEGDFHKFLGKPVGFNAVPNYSSLNDLGVKLSTSKLTPWERLDALKAFFYSSLQFPMRTTQFPKGDWTKIDKALLKEVKNTLNLPSEASNEYVYGQRKLGCCGLPIAAEDSDINLVDTAFKLLSSRDELCARIALDSLQSTVHRRLGKLPDDQTLSDYLSGDIGGDFSTTTNKFSNTWTVARVASRRLGIQWIFENSVPSLVFQDLTLKVNNRRKILFSIQDRLRNFRTTTLLWKKNQGKVMEVVSLAPASSHFIADGAFSRFADWRFIHRARLNLVPLNGAKPWLRENDQRCRRCGYRQETLSHVLNHCSRYSHAWQLRHNSIVDRLVAALGRRGDSLL